mmetsp:Transcript_39940/g.66452  ORF Transcript_39940/g.66452 Transcript_39940/m.66452 type:complete len:232 (+) Transcript_39940:2240-2935(+)
MNVQSTDYRSHDDGEDFSLAGGFGELSWVEQIDTGIRPQTPIVVLTTSVDACEGLLVEQCSQPVLSGNFVNDRHHHQILVDLALGNAKHWSALVLIWGHLPVPGAQRDAHAVRGVLHVLHHGQCNAVDGSHVVIGHLLASSRQLAHHGAPRHLQIHTLVISLTGDQEKLLLQPDHGVEALDGVPQVIHQANALLRHSLLGTQQRSLLVHRVTVPGDEAGWNVDGVVTEENW